MMTLLIRESRHILDKGNDFKFVKHMILVNGITLIVLENLQETQTPDIMCCYLIRRVIPNDKRVIKTWF